MSSGKNSGFGEFWDKNETKYNDVGLGLRLQQQHQQQQNHVYSSSGGELTRVVPFTPNQRQELERQTVIYKYMMASMPVPPELIIPLSKYPPQPQPQPQLPPSNATRKAAGEVRYHHGIGRGAGGDPEPWRCRRTDGKKWRCSRDVAPDQKYCERHSHKGRPSTRSRKPVESSLIASATSTTNASTTTTTTTMDGNSIVLNPFQQHPSSFDLQSSFRYPEWFTKEEVTVPPSAQVLYPEQMEQFSHSHTSEFTPESDRATRPLSRPFIDAWSLEDVHKNKCPNTSSSMNTILPLTLSMSAGFDLDNGQNNPKDDEHNMREIRSSHQQPLNWMSSWSNMPSGGPLAEALCLGMSGTNNTWGSHSEELVSPHGHSSGSTGTTMSSKGSHASGDNIGQGFHLQ